LELAVQQNFKRLRKGKIKLLQLTNLAAEVNFKRLRKEAQEGNCRRAKF